MLNRLCVIYLSIFSCSCTLEKQLLISTGRNMNAIITFQQPDIMYFAWNIFFVCTLVIWKAENIRILYCKT